MLKLHYLTSQTFPLISYCHLDYIGISDKHLYYTNLEGEFIGTVGFV